jgi:hypothetical protein
MKVDRAKELEHRAIVHCNAHRDAKVIKAMDISIKHMRKEHTLQHYTHSLHECEAVKGLDAALTNA